MQLSLFDFPLKEKENVIKVSSSIQTEEIVDNDKIEKIYDEIHKQIDDIKSLKRKLDSLIK